MPQEHTMQCDQGQHVLRRTKKEQLIALYLSGVTDLEELADITQARPSYIGHVLQQAGLLHSYFDLYTSVAHPMNVYSKQFANKLGFKNEAAARHSVDIIEHAYQQFSATGDRAGQHHALSMALIIFDRARWSGKVREADIFRRWLIDHLTLDDTVAETRTAAHVQGVTNPE